MRGAGQMYFGGAAAAREAYVARATPRCMKHPCKQRTRARRQLRLHAVGSQSNATRLRWSCDCDLIKYSLHFYSRAEAVMPQHWRALEVMEACKQNVQCEKRSRTAAVRCGAVRRGAVLRRIVRCEHFAWFTHSLIGTLIRLIAARMQNHCALTCVTYCVEVGL